MNDKKSIFNIPVVLMIFKREKVIQIIDRLREVNAQKIYLMSDEGRNEEEKILVRKSRQSAEDAIDWDCEVIKNYATNNRGVYGNIALGAKWVFEREKYAIFLEDDNLPELSFFYFCEELLYKYENNPKILWICGTNYLGQYNSNYSYMFTQHPLPCGWASWSNKFLTMYDGEMKNYNEEILSKIEKKYYNSSLYHQYKYLWTLEHKRIQQGIRPHSWDYQMDFSLKYYDVYGISPNKNQIKNIGVDEISEHGGNSFSNEMTRRFCGMDSYPLSFPLNHPPKIEVDYKYESKIAKILLFPWYIRLKGLIIKILKRIYKIPDDESIRKLWK